MIRAFTLDSMACAAIRSNSARGVLVSYFWQASIVRTLSVGTTRKASS